MKFDRNIGYSHDKYKITVCPESVLPERYIFMCRTKTYAPASIEYLLIVQIKTYLI